MSLADVEVLKKAIGLDSYDDEWIHNALITASPLGDFLVVSSGKAAVFYVKKLKLGSTNVGRRRQTFQILRTFVPENPSESGKITAITYFPAKVVTQRRTQDVWHCVVIGYESGLVEIVTDSGQILLSKQFSSSKVLNIRSCSCSGSSNALVTPRMQELLVVYESLVAAVDAGALFSSLITSKSEAARAKSRGDDATSAISNVVCKKLTWFGGGGDHEAADVASYRYPNVRFDQLHRISMTKWMNRNHLDGMATVSSYVSTGRDAFVQTGSPHQPAANVNINELAHNVMSTVKSGLSGLIWGNPADQSGPATQPSDPEVQLHLRHAFKDHSKSGSCIRMSPDLRYCAIIDDHNRILLLDNHNGCMTQMWKGYHRAQVGWITTSWESRCNDEKITTPPHELEIGVLLVIYLPRRGLLEVWSPEKKFRVAEFHVGKQGRLVNPSDCILDPSASSPFMLRAFGAGCAFLEPSGKIRHVYVPVHSLTSKSCSHDSTIQKQVCSMLLQKSLVMVDEETLSNITDLILSVKSTITKMNVALEVFKSKSVQEQQCRNVLQSLTRQLSENPTACKHCRMLERTLDLFRLVQGQHDDDAVVSASVERSTVDPVKDGLSCSEYEANNVQEILDLTGDDEEAVDAKDDDAAISVSEFFACFDTKMDNNLDDDDDAQLRLNVVADGKREMAKLVHAIASACDRDYDQVLKMFCAGGGGRISGPLLLRGLFQSCVHEFSVRQLIFRFGFGKFQRVCSLSFDLMDGGGAIDRHHPDVLLLLQQQAKVMLMNENPMTVRLYVTMLLWKIFFDRRDAAAAAAAAEWSRALFLTEAFIHIRRHGFVDEGRYTFKEVFNSGNGRVSELLAQWIIDARTKSKSEDVEPFLVKCAEYFPLSSNKHVVACHMAWDYFQRWRKNHDQLELLEMGVNCVKSLPSLSVRHRLMSLAWGTFFGKPARDAVGLTEIRSPTRCERELGFPQSKLKQFLCQLGSALKILLDSPPEAEGEEGRTEKKTAYDDISFNLVPAAVSSNNHLMDHVAKTLPSDPDVVAVQYQLVTCGYLIWSFELNDVIKPLSLFNNQEINLFFQGPAGDGHQHHPLSSSIIGTSLNIFSNDHSRGIRQCRTKFLELCFENAVSCIRPTSDSFEGELDTDEYHDWCFYLGKLGKLWNVMDKLQQIRIVSLYKGGFDSLGAELLNSIPDRRVLAHKLLRICLLRLTRFIFFAAGETKARVAALSSPELTRQLKLLKEEAARLSSDVPLTFTSDLLVLVSSLELEEQSQQLAYECLAIAQTFRNTSQN